VIRYIRPYPPPVVYTAKGRLSEQCTIAIILGTHVDGWVPTRGGDGRIHGLGRLLQNMLGTDKFIENPPYRA
jgi:hypothetical protein